MGQVFSEYFGVPPKFTFQRLFHIHHLSSETGTIGQLVADVSSGLSLTPPQETKKKLVRPLGGPRPRPLPAPPEVLHIGRHA
jgi:hypothetical protein